MLYQDPIFRIMGDRSLLVELGDEINPGINHNVGELLRSLEDHRLEGVKDLIPCYRSVMIIYDPLKIELGSLKVWVAHLHQQKDFSPVTDHRTVKVPVVYGGEYGPDLEWIARYHGITPEEVIRIHSSCTYRVYMIGFTPGHPYLGELPDELQTPRKEAPRTVVSRGSVGIAQKQIVIYPVQSPGGFQIIGRTPLILFDPDKNPPALFETGDQVEFYPVTEKEKTDWML
ncbi:MAG: 5-oxoprolinase subunit PxpB [Deltaproteobacteria bacterium]|nr:5-oxoprolinase subunit PxpB [Deltaproteobacteria bacterium]